ncbi:MAG: hypothetical protein JXB29_08930 [Sedimentisphaerales bacterium]|nr:hypothetical protein [Sedimentisphaerales bacterium]
MSSSLLRKLRILPLLLTLIAVVEPGCKRNSAGRQNLQKAPVGKTTVNPLTKTYPQPCSPDKWVKHGIVLEPNQPWEGNHTIVEFCSVPEPLGDGRWRIFYGSYGPGKNIGMAEGVPGGEMKKYQAALSEGKPANVPFAIGNLPEGWRPNQPVHIKLQDGRDRLYFWVHASRQGVIRYLAADSNDGRRYRVVNAHTPCLYHFSDRAIEFVGTTASGLKLTAENKKHRKPRPISEPIAEPELITNDGVTVYQLADGSFELYVNSLVSLEKGDRRWAYNDNLAGYIRVIDRLVSDDGLNWSTRQRAVEPDSLDPIDLQFYYLCVTHTSRGRVGMLGHYRVAAQTMDVEWCFSPDGVNWTRPFRRGWLERGKTSEKDSYCIFPAASMVQYKGKWWLFYTGVNCSHNWWDCHGKTPRSVIMLATTKSIWHPFFVPTDYKPLVNLFKAKQSIGQFEEIRIEKSE